MSLFSFLLGALIVLLSVKPSFIRSRKTIREARASILDLTRRRQMLSQKIRALARESLNQRLTAGEDDVETEEMAKRIAGLQHRLGELEAIDRRILVLDERRGLSETGWILCIRRALSSGPPLEPDAVAALWDEGRYVFFFASDPARARRKATVRFPEDQGFQIVEITPHTGDLSDVPSPGGGPKQNIA